MYSLYMAKFWLVSRGLRSGCSEKTPEATPSWIEPISADLLAKPEPMSDSGCASDIGDI